MKVGKIIAIDYSALKVKISSEIRGNSVNIEGHVYYFGNIGSYLKVQNAIDEQVVCEVTEILDSDPHKDEQSFNLESNREILLKTVGTLSKENIFSLGVGIFPALYSDVSIITNEDMESILDISGYTNEHSSGNQEIHQSFNLGTSKNLINYPIKISIDKFFNLHSAVLGNSGSGKSNTIAHILQDIYQKRDFSALGSKLIMFDVNGEYKQAFENIGSDNPNVIKYYKPNIDVDQDGYSPFVMPHFLLSLDEWSSFLLATDATQRPFWDKVLQESYRFYKIGVSNEAEQKKFINYFKYRICGMINSVLGQSDSDTSRITSASSVIAKIESIIQSNEELKNAASSNNLTDGLIKLREACVILFGENKKYDKGEKNLLQTAVNKISGSLNTKEIQSGIRKILDSKISNGEYFDYKFLKIACDMVLLEEDAKGNKQMRSWTSTMLTRLDYFLDNSDCKFMRQNEFSAKTAQKYLEEVFNIESTQSQLIIIDASELSPDILETLSSVICRLLFDVRKKKSSEDRIKNPIHLILDEAHRYLKKNYEYLMKENIFEKIAREGRKYSYYIMISSQRPSELSETVLSQCANFIIHRIQNEQDMRYVRAILPYFSEDFTNKIKQSVPGEALVFGNCVSMPLHIKIHQANPEPSSKNCDIPKQWFVDK
ncbi:ATP-binding protein [Candidatus Spongiihabitans sp.]|uniref:ATP-binding protein n=1 Tax=Candidatus Spongiihabitans sp. TaxID=3101308 RepID=UPI003C703C2D